METQLARGGTLIIGGGFAGASVARELGRRGCTIVTPEDELVYTPLLAEATGGELGLERVSVPARTVCPHAEILRGHATALDSTRRAVAVQVDDGETVEVGDATRDRSARGPRWTWRYTPYMVGGTLMPGMSKTTLYLPVELQHRLREEARRTGSSQADLVRKALESFLHERPRPVPRSIGVAADGSLDARDSEDWIRESWASSEGS